ncbi:MAG TPA: dihydrofolate reductase family protein [Pyrinomonadaceae bacterium]|jgi:dihydrofolate reductase
MITTHVYIGTSLDGFIARKNGSFDWLSKFADAQAIDAYEKFMAGIDVIVLGRGTFETVSGFPDWPYERPAVVLSRTLAKVPPRLGNKVSLSTHKPQEVLADLSEKGHRSVYVDGGKIIQSFLAEDLIDELTIARVPVLLGDGIPLFGFLSGDRYFEHRHTATYPNGLIRSYYTRQKRVQS